MSRGVLVLAVRFFGEEGEVFYPCEADMDQNRYSIAVLRACVHYQVNALFRPIPHSFLNLLRQIGADNTMIAEEYAAVARNTDQQCIFLQSTGLWARVPSDGSVSTAAKGIGRIRHTKSCPDENR